MPGGGYPYGQFFEDLLLNWWRDPMEEEANKQANRVSSLFGMGAASADPVTDPMLAPVPPMSQSEADAGIVRKPLPGEAQAKIAEFQRQKEIEANKPSDEEQRAQLQRETNMRSLDALIGNPESGVPFPADKLLAIRAQAKAKGRAGSLGANVRPDEIDYLAPSVGGGSFSQAANTPELQARLKERDEWVAGQPERDLAYATSTEQARRNPEYALGAADKLARLQAVKGEEKKLANQQALIDKISQGTGKVPFDIANQLDLAGFTVPWPMRGMSKDQAKEKLLSIQKLARADIEKFGFGGGPEHVVRYLQYVDSVMPELMARVEAGEDPDSIIDKAMELITTNADKSGTTDYVQKMGPPQEAK